MTAWTDILDRAIPAASIDGYILEPTAFLAMSRSKDRPLEALAHDDLRQDMFDVLSADLQFDWATRTSVTEFGDVKCDRLTGALRWLKASLATWEPNKDPKRAELTTILALGARLDENGALWSRLPDWATANKELARALATLVKHLKYEMRIGGFTRTPINDQEDLDQFLKAESDRDWVALRYYAEHIHFHFDSSAVFDQSIRLLNRFFPSVLAEALGEINQLATAMQAVTALPIEDSFTLAVASRSPILQFAAICRLFIIFDPIQSLSASERIKLEQLLVFAANDSALWKEWMRAFAARSYETHTMQAALGAALAALGEGPLRAYIDAISLDPSFLGRESIRDCLTAFADLVPLEKRQFAWRAFFDRWRQWEFGVSEDHHVITEISLSNVDFAIVGYAMECLSAEERESEINACMSLVGKTEDIWHASQRDMMNFSHRALARLQPFAHARLCSADRSSWLWNRDRGYFSEPLNDPYWISRFALFELEKKARQPNGATQLP